MNCKKCGAELHEDQKVCIKCGTRTIAGGNFDYGNTGPWRPTKKMIISAAAVVVLLIIVFVINAMRVIPPEIVAKQWFGAMADRKINIAKDYMAPDLVDQMTMDMGLQASADDYYTMITTEGGKYNVGKPQMSGSSGAQVAIVITQHDGKQEIRLNMTKTGRKWLISQVN